MNFDFSAFQAILPQFIIAGIIAAIFYMEFDKSTPKDAGKLIFIVPKEEDPQTTRFSRPAFLHKFIISIRTRANSLSSRTVKSTPYTGDENSVLSLLRGTHLVLLTVVMWILLSLALLPGNALSSILPKLPSYGIYAYIGLCVAFAASVGATVVSRISLTKVRLGILLTGSAIVTYLAFYLPALQWMNYTYSAFFKLIIVYCAVAVTVFGVYTISSLIKRLSALKVAVYGTYASYGLAAALLIINLLQRIHS